MPGSYDEWKSTEPDLDEPEEPRPEFVVLSEMLRKLDTLFPSAAPAQWQTDDAYDNDRKERATHMDAKSIREQLKRDATNGGRGV